jgi:uncharacterized protein (TIGR00255 family)
MTGFGEARVQDERWTVVVEVRAVNNRHFKLNARISEPFNTFENELERLVRESVRRGTVNLQVRVVRPKRAEDYRINIVALESYRDQLERLQPGRPIDLGSLLGLPGVVEDRVQLAEVPDQEWPALAGVVANALEKFQASRAEEGRAMAEELLALSRSASMHLSRIADRGPEVVASYQKRLAERVGSLLQEQGVTVEPRDLIREVAIFAERADVAEEVVRLRAHLSQFAEVIDEPESAGRKLEFVVQEMGRETNTIGSKANDIEISRAVVEIKGLLEKIRELIQNVE